MDKIIIKGLKLSMNLGLSEKERKKKQKVVFDVELFYDLKKAGDTDNIKDTINYSEVCNEIKLISKNEFKTLESLGQTVCSHLKEKFGPEQINLLIKKPSALRRYKTKYAAIEILR